jgi:hypothetical protein
MAKEMEHTHRNLYHAISAQDFAARIAALNARIPSLTRAEVIVEMAKIVAAVGDGHTCIYPTRDPKIGFHTLPVTFTFFGTQLDIRAVPDAQHPLLGARVLRIGNLDVDDAYGAVKTMIGHENDAGMRYWAQYLLSMPEVLEALYITPQVEDVPLTLATVHGQLQVMLPLVKVGWTCATSLLVPIPCGCAKSMCLSTWNMSGTFSTYRSTKLATVPTRHWRISLNASTMKSLPRHQIRWQSICGRIGAATALSSCPSSAASFSRRGLIVPAISSRSLVPRPSLPRRC